MDTDETTFIIETYIDPLSKRLSELEQKVDALIKELQEFKEAQRKAHSCDWMTTPLM